MGLDSTIVDEEVEGFGLEEDFLPTDEGNDSDLEDEEEELLPLELDGVYEAPNAFFIDVDAIDGNSGSVFANDTCVGDLTIEIDLDRDPPVFGRGDCVLQGFGIAGRGELSGEVDIYTGEIDGWIRLTLDTEPVEVAWIGFADEDTVSGEFEGSLPFSDESYNLELDYLGEFQADR
jgi:hypothetical protein